MFLDERVYHPL